MTSSNVDAIYAEYPFLSRLRPRSKVDVARVSRWDENFLDESTAWGDSFAGMGGIQNICFLDQHGNIVSRLGPCWRRILGDFLPGFFLPRTIGQVLAQMSGEKLRRIRYATLISREIILWKAPRGYDNAADWLNSRIEKARKELF